MEAGTLEPIEFTDEQKSKAISNYENFYKLDPGSIKIDHIERSSAGIKGWLEWV
jgi:hypothetical protein